MLIKEKLHAYMTRVYHMLCHYQYQGSSAFRMQEAKQEFRTKDYSSNETENRKKEKKEIATATAIAMMKKNTKIESHLFK